MMANWLYRIYKWGNRNQFLFFGLLLLWIGLSSFGLFKIQFDENILRILPKSEKTSVTAKVLDQLNFSDKISVIFEKNETGTTEDLTAMAEDFLAQMDQNEQVKSIQGKVQDEQLTQSIDFIYQHLPLFLDEKDYATFEQQIELDSVPKIVENNFRTLVSPTGLIAQDFVRKDPFGMGFQAFNRLKTMNDNQDLHLVDGFLMNEDESRLLLFIETAFDQSDTAKNTEFVRALNELKIELNQNYASRVQLDYFGAAFVAVANAQQIKSDIQKTVVFSISILMILLVIYYKKIVVPFILFIPTLVSALFALLILYCISPTISAISLSIAAILIGITIDYTLHILTHFKHCQDVEKLYQEITQPVLMSAATTAVAFLCLIFVQSEALRDLGIFASITVMGSGIFSLLLIPHLFKISKQKTKKTSNTLLDRLANFPFDRSKVLLGIGLLALIVSLFTFQKVRFDKDIASLNYFPTALQEAEKKLENTLGVASKSIYLTTYGDDLEKVIQNNQGLSDQLQKDQENQSIDQFTSLGKILLTQAEQNKRIARWEAFWQKKNTSAIEKSLIEEGKKVGFNETTYQAFFDILNAEYKAIDAQQFAELNPELFQEFFQEKEGFYTLNTLVKIKDENKEIWTHSLSNFENLLVIDRKELNESFLGHIVQDFTALINYSFLAVLLILWLFFRRIELVLVAMVPILITGLITAGMMGLLGIDFNIFSTIVCTLIIGQGVDFTIFMTHALQKEYTTGKDDSPTYRTSIILAVLTTLLAVGTLIFAQHPALRSISIISIIGMSVAALTSFVIYPRLFRLCFTQRQQNGKSPISFSLLFFSVLTWLYFLFYGIFYTISSRIIYLFFHKDEKKKLKKFKKGMHHFMKSSLNFNPLVQTKINNPFQENFEKPAIIIANHTSFLDSLAMGMTHPYVVYLVNDWVYNSPVFGKAIQMAGFYPVSEGVENSIEHLKNRVNMGFSLMIFPEGTRSNSNQIQRFHKGAFYLAETLQMDIVPVYIHGNSEVMPKGDFIFFPGEISTTIGQRIAHEELSFGKNYTEKTKTISRYFKTEFESIRAKKENVDYFKQKLFLAYLYKFPEIVKTVKTDFESFKQHYYVLNQYISSKEKIFHWADDFGQIDFLLTINQSKRNICTWIANKEKRAVAANNYWVRNKKIHYPQSAVVENSAKTLLISACPSAITSDFYQQFEHIIYLKKPSFHLAIPENFDQVEDNTYLGIWKKTADEKDI